MARAVAGTALAIAAFALSPAAAHALDERGYPPLRPVTGLGERTGGVRALALDGYPALREPSRLAFPPPEAVAAARRYCERRHGRVAFAVADARGGFRGLRLDDGYRSASLVKAMILVAFLERADRSSERIAEHDRSRLDAMIRVSDNDSATALFRRLGPRPLLELARRAGMRSFTVGHSWGDARVTARDQARFFLVLDRLLPSGESRDYARYLLEAVAPLQSWGIPEAARRRRWRVLFKGGWRPDRAGDIVHQAGVLERGPQRLAVAVLSEGNPSEAYGRETVKGVAERLLRRAPRRRPSARSAPSRPSSGPLRAVPLRKVGSPTVYFHPGLR